MDTETLGKWTIVKDLIQDFGENKNSGNVQIHFGDGEIKKILLTTVVI